MCLRDCMMDEVCSWGLGGSVCKSDVGEWYGCYGFKCYNEAENDEFDGDPPGLHVEIADGFIYVFYGDAQFTNLYVSLSEPGSVEQVYDHIRAYLRHR